MKNSASNLLQIQALQIQAEQGLPLITHAMTTLGYQSVVHQRISQQNTAVTVYQGLTRATDDKFGQVMIKWEISKDIAYNLTRLNYEIKTLKALDSFKVQAQNLQAIASPVLDYKNLPINIAEQTYQLTILVMPYYPQGSLAQYLKRSLTLEQKHQLITQAAYLIASLHQQGWLHNDIKPSNFLMSNLLMSDFLMGTERSNTIETIHPTYPTYHLLLTDFALAQRFDSVNNQNNSTANVNAAGTPAYLAPERWQGQAATEQSDIYAFGIMVYQILTGDRPFKIEKQSSEPLKAWATQHCQQPVPLLPKIYRDYQFIINRALAKRIANRYQSMKEVIADLDF